jgi:glutamate carboxypeptidase
VSLSARESTLCDRIRDRAPALLDDLRRHVAIPTGMNNAPGLDQARTLLTDRLRRLGASISFEPGDPRPGWLGEGDDPAGPIPPTAICRRLHAPGARCRVMLCGHLDTVHDPRGDFRELTLAPDGLRATGPGCADMKGGLVIAVAALEALDDCDVPVAWSFVLNSDEETGSFHSDAAIRREARTCDAGLVMEPALPDGSLVIERPGSGQFLIDCRGVPAHVGRDFASGASAVVALARRIGQVHAMVDLPRGRIASVGVIRGGTATNIVPEHARGWGNVRFRSDADGQTLAASLDSLAGHDGQCLVDVRTIFNRPAKPRVPAVDHLAGLARDAAADLGQSLPFGTTGGVCDGNNMQAAGLPTIDTLGVRGGGLHTPQEWIDVPSLVDRCQLLAVLLARLAERGMA